MSMFALALALLLGVVNGRVMFKISIVDTESQRKLIVEGRLVSPWTAEVESTWKSAQDQLNGRRLIIDLSNVTVISLDGENTLLTLMREGAEFSGEGILTKHVLNRLAQKCRCPA